MSYYQTAPEAAPPPEPAPAPKRRARIPAGSKDGAPGAFVADDPTTPENEAWEATE